MELTELKIQVETRNGHLMELTELKIQVEQFFFQEGRTPLNKELEQLDPEFLQKLPELNAWIRESGLRQASNLLEPKQFIVAQMLLNTADRRSLRTKLKEANVTVAQFDRWRRTGVFTSYLRKEVQRRFKDADVSADLELVKLIEDGDLNSIKYYNEMTGRYQSPEEVNIQKVLATIMEILVQYVGSDVLVKVARELETKVLSRSIEVGEVSNDFRLELSLD